jgi:hypothetical protein
MAEEVISLGDEQSSDVWSSIEVVSKNSSFPKRVGIGTIVSGFSFSTLYIKIRTSPTVCRVILSGNMCELWIDSKALMVNGCLPGAGTHSHWRFD